MIFQKSIETLGVQLIFEMKVGRIWNLKRKIVRVRKVDFATTSTGPNL